MTLDKEILEFRDGIYSDLRKSKKGKYKNFIKALDCFRFLSYPDRADLLESYYAAMRYVDDIVDGDRPHRYQTREEFIQERICLLGKKPRLEVDRLIDHCLALSRDLDIDLLSETKDILGAMVFDAKRYGRMQIFPKKELDDHSYLLDIKGTIKATLKIFNEDPNKCDSLKPIGYASKIYYNLRDYEEDISCGIVNISSEDFKKFGIGLRDSTDINSKPVQEWIRSQAEEGLGYIEEHRKSLKKEKFNILSHLALKIVYEMPAKSYFRKILS